MMAGAFASAANGLFGVHGLLSTCGLIRVPIAHTRATEKLSSSSSSSSRVRILLNVIVSGTCGKSLRNCNSSSSHRKDNTLVLKAWRLPRRSSLRYLSWNSAGIAKCEHLRRRPLEKLAKRPLARWFFLPFQHEDDLIRILADTIIAKARLPPNLPGASGNPGYA